MTKLNNWLEKNGIKTLVTMIIVCAFFLQIVYMAGIRNNITLLQKQITTEFSIVKAEQDTRFKLSLHAYSTILETLGTILDSNQFIIDQNRVKLLEDKKTEQQNKTKPTYEELKTHTVYIIGCSEKDNKENDLVYPITKDDQCWSGTGVIVKITNTETFILTNNHIAGQNQESVKLYVENKTIQANVVKYNNYVDLAIIKIDGNIKDKTPIPRLNYANIQDQVYVVGNPLGNKMTYSEGVVANFIGKDMLIQVPLIYGNSGSGIFNSSGELVGLCYALQMYPGFFGIPMAQITHSICVDGVSIKVFLKDLGLLE